LRCNPPPDQDRNVSRGATNIYSLPRQALVEEADYNRSEISRISTQCSDVGIGYFLFRNQCDRFMLQWRSLMLGGRVIATCNSADALNSLERRRVEGSHWNRVDGELPISGISSERSLSEQTGSPK
jgi:hypothetical protein